MAMKGHNRQGYCVLSINDPGDGTAATETLGTGVLTNHVVTFTGSPGSEDTELYAGDVLEESESSPVGSVKVELSQLPLKDEAALGGHTYSEDDGMTVSENDSAPYVRYAAIGVGVRKGVTFYRLVCYYKVKFGAPDDDFATKEKTVSYKTHSMSGTTFPNASGSVRFKQDYTTFEAALTKMKDLLNIKGD